MAIVDVIANGIATAKRILSKGKMLPTISIETMAATQNVHGERTVASTQTVEALIEDVDVVIRRPDGREVLASTRITLFEHVEIDGNTQFIVNGRTAPIERVDRGVLAADGKAQLIQVYLGRLVART